MKTHSPAHIVEYVSEYIFLISKNKQISSKTRVQKKQTNKQQNKNTKKTNKQQQNKNTKKAKETKEEKRISPEN